MHRDTYIQSQVDSPSSSFSSGMLLEVTTTEIKFNGVVLSAKSPQSLLFARRSWNHYEKSDEKPAEDEQYIGYDTENRIVTIRTAISGMSPLAYHYSPGLVIIAPSAAQVVDALRKLNHYPAADKTGIFESLIFDHPLGDRTNHMGVYKTRMAEEIRLDVIKGERESAPYWIMPLSMKDSYNEAEAVNRGTDILAGILDDINLPNEIVVPLSGGLDSRLVCSLAVQRGCHVHSFTFGNYRNKELCIGERVARRLRVSWQPIELKPKDYLEFGRRVVVLTEGLSTPMHMHLFSALSALSYRDMPVLHGYMGDPVAGADATCRVQSDSAARAVEDFLKMGAMSHPVWQWLSSENRDSVREDLYRLAKECGRLNHIKRFPEYFHNVERQASLIAHVFSPVEILQPIVRPFANRTFMEFFGALPQEMRVGRRLFKVIARRLFPDIFNLPDTSWPDGGQLSHRLKRTIIRSRNFLQYASSWLTRNQSILFSPYLYEQHRYLLDTYLSSELAESIRNVGSFFDVCFTPFLHSSKRHSYNMTRFRLLALGWLIRHNRF